jgi:hypothetical protein
MLQKVLDMRYGDCSVFLAISYRKQERRLDEVAA